MVVLKDYKEGDVEHLVTYLNKSEVTKYLTTRIPQPYTSKDAEWWVNDGSKTGITKAIEVDGEFAGTIGVSIGDLKLGVLLKSGIG